MQEQQAHPLQLARAAGARTPACTCTLRARLKPDSRWSAHKYAHSCDFCTPSWSQSTLSWSYLHPDPVAPALSWLQSTQMCARSTHQPIDTARHMWPLKQPSAMSWKAYLPHIF